MVKRIRLTLAASISSPVLAPTPRSAERQFPRTKGDHAKQTDIIWFPLALTRAVWHAPQLDALIGLWLSNANQYAELWGDAGGRLGIRR